VVSRRPADRLPLEPRIAFASQRDGNDEIYTMNADGSAETNRTNNPAADARPDWSPRP
jgi:Tol biopolymer transport system component